MLGVAAEIGSKGGDAVLAAVVVSCIGVEGALGAAFAFSFKTC